MTGERSLMLLVLEMGGMQDLFVISVESLTGTVCPVLQPSVAVCEGSHHVKTDGKDIR